MLKVFRVLGICIGMFCFECRCCSVVIIVLVLVRWVLVVLVWNLWWCENYMMMMLVRMLSISLVKMVVMK